MKSLFVILVIQLCCGFAFANAISLKQAVKESARDRAAAAATFHANHIEAKPREVIARSESSAGDEESEGRSTASEDDEDFEDDLDLDLDE